MTQVAYAEVLQTLSEGSVHTHFDAFEDISWDDPSYAIDHTDARWVLPAADPLGGHPWYISQSLERQIEIGIWRQANVAKVGMQFENVLIRGIMDYVAKLPNGSPEFRYLTHEATEETHHTQMFQEFVNRAGVDVPGGPKFFRAISPFLGLAGSLLPEIFFTGVLAGEEPIDHIQKSILRSSDDLHPLFQRIMQIHVAEEARHISFAHEYIRQTVPTLNPARKMILSIAFPIIMRWLCDTIVVPGQEITDQVGVPQWVIREIFWDSPEGKKMLRDLFADVRMLAADAGLMNPVSIPVWKALGIYGRPSRFRGEPASLAA